MDADCSVERHRACDPAPPPQINGGDYLTFEASALAR